jgi:hypothetical protein
MSGKPKRTKKELRRRSEELALREREVLLGLTVILALTSVIASFLGVHWPVPTGSSIGAGLTALGARLRQ